MKSLMYTDLKKRLYRASIVKKNEAKKISAAAILLGD